MKKIKGTRKYTVVTGIDNNTGLINKIEIRENNNTDIKKNNNIGIKEDEKNFEILEAPIMYGD